MISIFETFIFASPFVFNFLLWVTKTKITPLLPNGLPTIITTFHNYNMVLQSCVLFSLSMYEYVSVANNRGYMLTDFINVSNAIGTSVQQGEYTWIMNMFIASKLWEWIDTILLMANKKPIIFLHWWHHSTITWAFYTGAFCSSNFTIGFLNSFIHIIMYLYYADVKFIKPYAKYLTSLQIVQLFSGAYMNWISYNYNTDMKYKVFSIINGCICMSYGLLFLQFFKNKYTPSNTKTQKHVINDSTASVSKERDI